MDRIKRNLNRLEGNRLSITNSIWLEFTGRSLAKDVGCLSSLLQPACQYFHIHLCLLYAGSLMVQASKYPRRMPRSSLCHVNGVNFSLALLLLLIRPSGKQTTKTCKHKITDLRPVSKRN